MFEAVLPREPASRESLGGPRFAVVLAPNEIRVSVSPEHHTLPSAGLTTA